MGSKMNPCVHFGQIDYRGLKEKGQKATFLRFVLTKFFLVSTKLARELDFQYHSYPDATLQKVRFERLNLLCPVKDVPV